MSRLTRLGQRKAASTILSLAFLAALLPFLIDRLDAGDVPADARVQTYTVQPGDTLWGIAERFDPQTDPMAVEFWVEQHDGLTEQQQLQPGEQIDVPIGG